MLIRIKYIGSAISVLISIISYGQIEPEGWASLSGGTTGGFGGDTIKVSNAKDLHEALKRTGKRIVLITDTIWLSGERLDVNHGDITILGTENSMLHNGGLKVHADNIIIRNLSIGDSYKNGHWDGKGNAEGDAITVYGKNVWIDHCDLFHAFDGLLDIGKEADFVTVSWTKFSNHNKVMLIGNSDNDTISRGHLRTSVHHCWFDGYSSFFDSVDNKYYNLQQRMPRVRFGRVHVYNNYYESAADYCVAARLESDVVVEDCFFRNLRDPLIIDDLGKGKKDPELVAKDNYYENVKGNKSTNGNAFNPIDFYTYQPDEVILIPAMVMNGAGKFDRNSNHNPVAVDDSISITDEDVMKIRPLDNDYDPDGDKLRISSVLNKSENQVIIYPDYIEYKPVKSTDKKHDVIQYQIIDYNGGISSASCYIHFR